jgi:hypothetical protein
MRYRIYFVLVTMFFITMNVLLWRSEFGARGNTGAPVPAELVWEKVLTSPDNSYLEIRHHGDKVGRAHWAPSIGEELADEMVLSEELLPEGMIQRPTGYMLDFNGTVSLDHLSRLNFDLTLKLNTNQAWRELTVKVRLKPVFSWELQSSAEKQTVRLSMEEDTQRSEREYTFADLRNPEKIARDLGGPTLSAALAGLGISLPKAAPSTAPAGLKWEARNDRLKIGNNFIRVYRLEARLFDRIKIALFVSPVGEILRMELPDEIVLSNDALTSL